MTTQVNRIELENDIEGIEISAARFYEAQATGKTMDVQKAADAHRAVLDAFIAKYGSLRTSRIR